MKVCIIELWSAHSELFKSLIYNILRYDSEVPIDIFYQKKIHA